MSHSVEFLLKAEYNFVTCEDEMQRRSERDDRMNLGRYREWILPEEDELSRDGIARLNMRLIGRVSPLFLGLTVVLSVVYGILYLVFGSRYTIALLSVSVCALMFVLVVSVSRTWERDALAVKKRSTRWIIESLYWMFTAWGIVISWKMYLHGSQMMIMDTVQIGFLVLVCCYPAWGVIRVLIGYIILFVLLFQADGAAQINYAVYSLMIAMICFGTVLRYGVEMRNLKLVRDLNSHTRYLEQSSSHDELTGMKNRAALRGDFPSYCGKKVGVIMADVDHFKRYNDTYGHEIGDVILKAYAQEIVSCFGKECTYRYGGDEFLIILEEGDDIDLSAILLVWSDAIGSIRLDVLPEEDHFSCSYGYTEGIPADEKKLRDMVVLADKKLYEMKRSRQ